MACECIASAQTKSAKIGLPGEIHCYTFWGEAGQGVAIQMAVYSASSSVHARLQLYDPDGIQVVDWPGYAVAEIDNYQLKKTGMYTIVVSDVYGVAAGAYGLSVSVMPPKSPYGLYPYDPQPSDGNSVNLCDWDALSWWPVDGATGYDVYFAGGPCMPLEKVAENITDPHLPMPAVEGGQVCTWRVVAHTPSGDVQGPTWWFAAESTSCCALTISAIGRGAIVDPNAGFHEYSCGDVVPVTAATDPNYEFVRWEGTAVDANKVIPDPTDPTKVLVTVDGAYTLTAVFEEVVYDFPPDSNPGWSMNGQWEFGVPKGKGCEYGNPDPTSGHTGQNVIGVNLNGCYDTAVGGPYSVVAGPFDLRGYKDVRLRFWRWLNADEPRYVPSSVYVSINGQNWRTLWESETEITDSRWILIERPLGPEADGQPTVYLRWTYQVLRERAYPYSGWNLDDIQVCGKRQ
jgi:hypothetical protein